jgi:hypothetical protein
MYAIVLTNKRRSAGPDRRQAVSGRIARILGVAGVAAFLLVIAGCSTLDVTVPNGMFLSTGDYVPGIRTLGVIQESSTVFAPLFLIDLNKVNQGLYERLIARAQSLGANGVTDVKFSWKPSPFTYLTVVIASGVFDFYVEGIAIKKQ